MIFKDLISLGIVILIFWSIVFIITIPWVYGAFKIVSLIVNGA